MGRQIVRVTGSIGYKHPRWTARYAQVWVEAVLVPWLDKNAEQYKCQLEKGEGDGFIHVQYAVHMKDAKELADMTNWWRSELKLDEKRWEDNDKGAAFRLEPCRSWEASTKYCEKSKTQIAGPWTNMEITIDYQGEDIPKKLEGWQETAEQLALNSANDRHIYWIYDRTGKKGKSKWAKYMAWHHKAVILNWANEGDIAQALSKIKDKKIIIFNLTREKPGKLCEKDLYTAIEGCKDGYMFVGKYESKPVLWAGSTVIVLSNQRPDKSALSADRWVEIDISDHEIMEGNEGPTIDWNAEFSRNRKRKRTE